MKASEIRNQFFDFFKEKGHAYVRSAPLVSKDDPTLLFINAGMNQFKNIFLGKEKPKHLRVVNSQKCIRVSGKHNDLDEVGYDTFHHTFFEMLGNWSFGDYYKAEAIQWAWELLTDVWGLEKDRLWATVYDDDDEADKLWKKVTDIAPDRVLRFGKKDNFWEMGDSGPCGPCSEIHYYVGKDPSKQSEKGINVSDQYWELWNLVFIQNNRLSDGTLNELPKKHVDTGAGLERIAAVLQGKTSNYDTDLFQSIIGVQEKNLGVKYEDDLVGHRAIADHIRMLSFSIADGVLPSNEGRGYVARRILRRAARFGHSMGKEDPFLSNLVETVVELMGDVYPELVEKQSHVEKVIKAEEIGFNETLDRGLEQFDKIVTDLSGKTISGEAVFKLYDTFGFPVDLTEQMAREKRLSVDIKGFDKAMEEQRKKSRSVGKFKLDVSDKDWTTVTEGDDSEFLGYSGLSSESTIRKYHCSKGTVLIVLDKTPFYSEQGGQVGDTGNLSGNGFTIRVTDTVKEGASHIHVGEFEKGDSINGETVTAQVDDERREKIKKNHTATHLLHKALKNVLGDHVQQAGSFVHSDYLRFDLTHYQKITFEGLRQIEEMVNDEIQKNTPLDITVKDYNKAKDEGAEAIFEEKYADKVRVITIGEFSKELCGGTHVGRTGDIGLFKITEESSLSSGVRRIMAVTGPGAINCVLNGFESLETIKALLNCSIEEVEQKVETLMVQRKKLEKELKKQRSSTGEDDLTAVVESARSVGEKKVVVSRVEAEDMDHLKSLGDQLRILLKSGVGVLGTVFDDKPCIACVVTDDLVKLGVKATDFVKQVGKELGGGGGGKPHFATAGGKDPAKLDGALKAAEKMITAKL
ncbi:MAG TPA: alanine--tRNA ligase [Candidatus Marinimicrobia bacterium]|nr:alanine--tRNA ligase [Candidatus Neomarinimicrobiota bacterium]HIB71655.1 alanine--tRNA ligase [Candidatus Neomarinimicrobiota bacterium]HIB95014.1 alanine--tRNA ligase [Candidatus Neomarinimicrobiota bacterium]HIN61821.1 alanine--tRNA ligase [Candidatus Neomarinimicrobiota bacterium]HIO75093.1 alanine--tRNA ligase [Candidatus Neomarinimicrobiota bacterium]